VFGSELGTLTGAASGRKPEVVVFRVAMGSWSMSTGSGPSSHVSPMTEQDRDFVHNMSDRSPRHAKSGRALKPS